MGRFSYQALGISDKINVVPYAQILNPIKHPCIGFGIVAEQSSLTGFKPDENWQVKTIMIGDKEQTVYNAKKARFLVLAQSDLYMAKDSHIIKYDPSKKDEGYKPRSYIVVWFVDKNNVPLSDLPFRLKTSSAIAGRSLRETIKAWQNQLLSAYKACEGSLEGLSWSAGVLEVEWEKSQVESPEKKKINVSKIKEFSPVTKDNLEDYFVLPESQTGLQLPAMKKIIKSWCDLEQVSQEYKDIDTQAIDNTIENEEDLRFECISLLDKSGFSTFKKMEFLKDNFGEASLNKIHFSKLPELKHSLEGIISDKKSVDDESFPVPF